MTVQHLPTRPAPATAQSAAKPRRKRIPTLLIIFMVLGLAAAAAGAWLLLRPIPVTVAQSERGPAVDAVYASGVVEYVRQARIAPVVTAPIRQVLVIEGQNVRPGQALAQLDDGPQEGSTLQLEAQAALARAEARRTERLYRAGFAAAAAHEDAQQCRAAAEAAARSARARLADYRLTAPFAGRVLRRDAEPGDLATVGAPLFVVADPAALRIRADVDERDVGRLAVGQDAVVRSDAFPGRTFPARIAEITPQGDATGRIFRVRLSLAADTPLRPGMTVESNLVVSRRENAVLVPTKAIRDDAVWTLDGDRARRRPVRLGAQGPERTEVASGLAAGSRVILEPPAKLKDGARVRAAD
jgi:RND family efflux transporter MFP subunit